MGDHLVPSRGEMKELEQLTTIRGNEPSAILDLIAEIGCRCGSMNEAYEGHTCLSGRAGQEYESMKITIEALTSTLNRTSEREEYYEELIKRWMSAEELTSMDRARLVADSFDLLDSSPV